MVLANPACTSAARDVFTSALKAGDGDLNMSAVETLY